MPKITPRNQSVLRLKGLHLYHAGWSNCSMRVRMTLEEKGLAWTSHHLNTRTGEHVTPEYFGINPNGVVPTLVHDGDVWIESSDIIRYLDDTYPERRLTPVDEIEFARLTKWTRLASAIHVKAVKTYVYGSKPANRRGKTASELEQYRELQTNKELLEFHTRCSNKEGLTGKDFGNAERILHDAFSQLDVHLANHSWLAGDDFTLADITWIPLHYTLEKAGFSFEQYVNVSAWALAAGLRPSFQNAVVNWFDGPSATNE